MPSTSNELKIENQLWETADVLRGSMDPSDYSNVVLGLIFLKYISDSFEEEYYKLKHSEYPEDAEDKLAYTAHNIFWLPKESRWNVISSAAKSSKVGKVIDNAMGGIENENNQLKGILPRNYESPDLDVTRLGEVIDLITNIPVGTAESRNKDILGRVYEFFLNQFASAEGKHGGDFYTPRSVVKTLVEMVEPFKGRVYDPCCGSGGMFVQSQEFIKEHRGNTNDISIYGQESNPKTWKLCKMNLAIRGIDSNLGPHNGDTLANDLHKGERFDYILANPPFNMSWDHDRLKSDPRWIYGVPTTGYKSANFIWLQHIISKLKSNGKAGVVLANGALTTQQSNQGNIRKEFIDNHKIDAIVSLPDKMFYTTSIPASLWIINNRPGKNSDTILFINASNMGKMVDKNHRSFDDHDIKLIAHTYHKYSNNYKYHDITGFCKSVPISKIRNNNYSLMPGVYVGIRRNRISKNKLSNNIKNHVSNLNILLNQGNTLRKDMFTVLENVLMNVSSSNIRNSTIYEISNGHVITGKTPPTKDKSNYGKDIPFITIPDMHNQIFTIKTSKMLSKKGANLQKKKYLPPFSLSVSSIGTPGLVTINPVVSQTNQQINSIIVPRKYLWLLYIELSLIRRKFKVLGSGGTTMPNINKTSFSQINITLLTGQALTRFNMIVKPMFLKMLSNQKQNIIMNKLKNEILINFLNNNLDKR